MEGHLMYFLGGVIFGLFLFPMALGILYFLLIVPAANRLIVPVSPVRESEDDYNESAILPLEEELNGYYR